MIRPGPDRVREILRDLFLARPGTTGLSISELARAIQRETGCSRATAFRAVADAVQAGAIQSTEHETTAT